MGKVLLFLAVIAGVMAPVVEAAQQPTQGQVTFTKDVAPIFQRSCQVCHRPGAIAPMSLLTYEDARPWARSIKQNVSTREMPPWHVDRTIGIQKFKNDISLSDTEVDTIVKWVDNGAVRGNPADMPPPRQFEDVDKWHIGTPDLIVTSKPVVIPATGPDKFPEIVVPSGLTEDRYIKAIETKPAVGARRVVHHLLTFAGDEPEYTDTSVDYFLNEYAMGKNGDIFPEGSGKLLKAGSFIRFSYHLHSVGEEVKEQSQVAFVFYPKGEVPKRVIYLENLGGANGARTGIDLDVPAGQIVRHDGYSRLHLPAKITGFQPHMHTRGKRTCIELIYPDDTQEVLNCTNFHFGWHIVYDYADDVAPLVPAGTILHVINWHDNSVGSKGNPDPTNWVGPGARTIDEMSNSWISWYDLTENEYKQEVEARKAARKAPKPTFP